MTQEQRQNLASHPAIVWCNTLQRPRAVRREFFEKVDVKYFSLGVLKKYLNCNAISSTVSKTASNSTSSSTSSSASIASSSSSKLQIEKNEEQLTDQPFYVNEYFKHRLRAVLALLESHAAIRMQQQAKYSAFGKPKQMRTPSRLTKSKH
jgi:hypothetical protein